METEVMRRAGQQVALAMSKTETSRSEQLERLLRDVANDEAFTCFRGSINSQIRANRVFVRVKNAASLRMDAEGVRGMSKHLEGLVARLEGYEAKGWRHASREFMRALSTRGYMLPGEMLKESEERRVTVFMPEPQLVRAITRYLQQKPESGTLVPYVRKFLAKSPNSNELIYMLQRLPSLRRHAAEFPCTTCAVLAAFQEDVLMKRGIDQLTGNTGFNPLEVPNSHYLHRTVPLVIMSSMVLKEQLRMQGETACWEFRLPKSLVVRGFVLGFFSARFQDIFKAEYPWYVGDATDAHMGAIVLPTEFMEEGSDLLPFGWHEIDPGDRLLEFRQNS